MAEGCRWFDVIRLQDGSGNPLVFSADAAYPNFGEATAAPVLSSSEQYKLLWPVDVTVLNADELLRQTWGYEEAIH